MYTLDEAALHFGVTKHTLRAWVKKAGVETALDEHDARARLLSHEQMVKLAELHGRHAPVRPHPTRMTMNEIIALKQCVTQSMQFIPECWDFDGEDVLRLVNEIEQLWLDLATEREHGALLESALAIRENENRWYATYVRQLEAKLYGKEAQQQRMQEEQSA